MGNRGRDSGGRVRAGLHGATSLATPHRVMDAPPRLGPGRPGLGGGWVSRGLRIKASALAANGARRRRGPRMAVPGEHETKPEEKTGMARARRRVWVGCSACLAGALS